MPTTANAQTATDTILQELCRLFPHFNGESSSVADLTGVYIEGCFYLISASENAAAVVGNIGGMDNNKRLRCLTGLSDGEPLSSRDEHAFAPCPGMEKWAIII